MDSDEDFARQLQAQFDEEERVAREREQKDAVFAQKLASQSHDLSDTDEDVVEVDRSNEIPEEREVVDLDSNEEDEEREVLLQNKDTTTAKSIPQHTISDDDVTDIEDFGAAEVLQPKTCNEDPQSSHHNDSLSRKVPEHTISDDDTDIEDVEVPVATPKSTVEKVYMEKKSEEEKVYMEKKSEEKTDTLVKKGSEHTLSDDDDTEDSELPSKVSEPETTVKESNQTDITHSSSQATSENKDTLVKKGSEHTLSDDDDTEDLELPSKVSEPETTAKESNQTDITNSSSQASSENKDESKSQSNPSKKRPLCKFGSDCYRKNPWHLEEFYHPHLEDKESTLPNRKSESSSSEPPVKRSKSSHSGSSVRKDSSLSKRMPFPERLMASGPYNFFVNKSFSVKETHEDPLSLVFPDLLNPQLGEIVESVQLNFMVDLDFLMSNYKAGKVDKKPLLVMYGQMEGNPKDYADVTCTKVNLDFQYGTHHTKMMIFQYTDSLRVVIHTANLVPNDWYEKTQGYWISPAFPLLEDGKAGLLDGESPTRFKRDLVEYLLSYKAPDLTRWSHIIKKYDFSSCNVIFVGSSPGYHTGEHKDKWGHMKARRAIRLHGGSWTSSAPIIAQCSSIGSLGKDARSWLSGELGMSLTGAGSVCASAPKVSVVYPSEDDVRNSSEGWMGGSCLPYNSSTHEKQTWLRDCMHCWRSDQRKRTQAMPHIKTYTRLSKDHADAQFFLLTSANISKAAWGTLQKQNSQLFIRSYEAGVLLLPKFLTDTAEIKLSPSGFSLPYDVPLTPYPSGANPWFMNTNKSKPDIFGRTYP